jgi:hypothetical protein
LPNSTATGRDRLDGVGGVGRGGQDPEAARAERLDAAGGVPRAMQIDPAMAAAGDAGRGLEPQVRLDDVELLQAQRLGGADHRGAVERIVDVLDHRHHRAQPSAQDVVDALLAPAGEHRRQRVAHHARPEPLDHAVDGVGAALGRQLVDGRGLGHTELAHG